MDQNTPVLTETKKTEPAADRSAITKINTTETSKDQKKPCKKHVTSSKRNKVKHTSKAKQSETSETSSSSSSESSDLSTASDSSSDSDSDSSSDSPAEKKLKVKKLKAKLKAQSKLLKKQKKARKRAAAKAAAEEEEEEDLDMSDSDSLEDVLPKPKPSRIKPVKKGGKKARSHDDSDHIEYEEDPNSARLRAMKGQLNDLRFIQPGGLTLGQRGQVIPPVPRLDPYALKRRAGIEERALVKDMKPQKQKQKIAKRATKVAYKRVDQLWDQEIHNFKLTETAKNKGEAVWDQYIFTVRRKFDWEQKYQGTVVDIKSKPLKTSLQHIMANVKGISLVGETFHMDPNMLFLHLEEMREYADTLDQSATTRKRKEKKELTTQAQHLRVMVRYLDKDFAETKKTLYPMLENNQITFDLLWALFKPNAIAYCSTYGDQDEGRAFRMDFATKEANFMKGSWYNVEGRYLEYDGKSFGMGTLHTEVSSFQGVRKISSLECFPLQYHKDAVKIREHLIERGKKFVQLQGMNYRYHKGMAYAKRKKQVLKINIDGRIMVDPAIHRRINPNYPVSTVKRDSLEGNIGDDSDSDCGCESSSDDGGNTQHTPSEDTLQEVKRFKAVKMPDGQTVIVLVNSKDDPDTDADSSRAIQKQDSHEFSEEELLIASPIVLGFAFGEKLWLEFTVSGISDIVYNDEAFDTLVLPENQKDIIKALVSSHAFHAHKSIDDIISGKGRGLVAVLHGRPGTGKTLTAEGIADLLKCPLYMVSAGDLGTDPTRLEKELQNILDIAHSWGAILLLDEADVFLEQRSIHDIHRNALVSIFLRLLEYFQGILFLTTNRVETFDSAFVSRIHLSLRFQDLTVKAKRTVWKLFIDRVRQQEGMTVENITESDLSDLARRDVNGRQIKNLVRAAQALAIHEEKPLSMVHIRRVIEVAESFENDLKGGTGFTDAMRSKSPPPIISCLAVILMFFHRLQLIVVWEV